LLIVPVNTLENWKAEFRKWLLLEKENLPKIIVFDFSTTGIASRKQLAERWERDGGVMLVTHDTLSRACKPTTDNYAQRIFQSPGPDGK